MKTLIVLVGPTGVGKTALAISLAQRYATPVINADSRQLYRDLPIGTAAPTPAEQALAKHYFVSLLGLSDYYSAARYEAEALRVIAEEFRRRDVLLLSGGSMLYIDAVCRGIDDIPTVTEQTREWMRGRLAAEGLEALAEELRRVDPEYHALCDVKNTKRVVHALEICHQTGRTYTSFRTGVVKPRPFRIVKVGLRREREELFSRISRRVDEMMRLGLLEEARRVLPYRACNALNTVGYKELFRYIDGEWTQPFAVEKIKRNTRVYAKKQMTWFKKDAETAWFHADDAEAVVRYIDGRLAESEWL